MTFMLSVQREIMMHNNDASCHFKVTAWALILKFLKVLIVKAANVAPKAENRQSTHKVWACWVV